MRRRPSLEELQHWTSVMGRAQQLMLEHVADQMNKDKRFAAPEWRDNPLFDMIRQSYLLISDRLLGSVDALEGLDDKQRRSCASRPAPSSTR
jgi:hypothetical protein